MKSLYQIYLKHPIISTDSRQINPGCLFFALKGDNFDGNKYASKAIHLGAAYAIVDDPSIAVSDQYIVVNNVLQTLQNLAAHHRSQLSIPVIGITGTNGKTTTKELTNAVLSRKFNVLATEGNLNNHIGVPLTLLKINQEHEIAIIEMGANHPGEIKDLSEIASPDYGLITNIGKAHLEGFGSYEGVIKTKTELYNFIETNSGKIFINEDDELLKKLSTKLQQITYGTSRSSSLQGELINSQVYCTQRILFSKGWLYVQSKLTGNYNFSNIMAAATIGLHFDVDPLEIKNAIELYTPSNKRSEVIKTDNNTLILDAYNANPTSVNASLNNFFSIEHNHKIAILGDMLELGDYSEEEHQKIVDLLLASDVARIFLVGSHFAKTATNSDIRFRKFETTALLKEYIRENSLQECMVLIKGSRGIKLEDLLVNSNL
ncbi:UDP-N-acetylmuramoyl-tripeptide--D-alanyl-D-alanine ligase [Puteibacter caeruleilacunae]|nr:UDP-N-acetylmuramoyl-tripeptide--D-alanyl-D-alanine ligase [Puteibacter caeruleilacunae]